MFVTKKRFEELQDWVARLENNLNDAQVVIRQLKGASQFTHENMMAALGRLDALEKPKAKPARKKAAVSRG